MAVSSFLLEQDRRVKFTKTGNTTATLGSFTLDTAVSGFGGIDTGSVANSTFYYVYTVVNSGVVGLVASTSEVSPIGFTNYRKVGAFYTDSSGNIFKAYWFGQINDIVLNAFYNRVSGLTTTSDGISLPTVKSGPANTTKTIDITALNLSIIPNCVTTTDRQDGTVIYAVSFYQRLLSTPISLVIANNRTDSTESDSSTIISINKNGIDAVQPDWSR